MYRTITNNKHKPFIIRNTLPEKKYNFEKNNSNRIIHKKLRINDIENLFDLINERNKKIYIRNIGTSSSLRNAERIYSKRKFLSLNHEINSTEKNKENDKKILYSEKKYIDYNIAKSINIQKYNQKEMARIILNYKNKKNKVYSKSMSDKYFIAHKNV